MKFISGLLARFTRTATTAADPTDNRQILANAVNDATLLVMTASRQALQLDKDIVETVVQARQALDDGTLDKALETRFWNAYSSAAKDLQPVTVGSIRANYDPSPSGLPLVLQILRGRRVALSRLCASNYRLLSLVTLMLLIAIQIYWYFGWALTNDIATQAGMIRDLTTRQQSLEVPAPAPRDGSPPAPRTPQVRQQDTRLQEQIDEHRQWLQAAFNQLADWNRNLSAFTPGKRAWEVENFSGLPRQVQHRIHYVAAQNTLQAITYYILPILYGLIGACFYILRQLSREIDSHTFSINSYTDYGLRMTQGPLAGIIVSYFLAEERSNPLAGFIGTAAPTDTQLSLSLLSPLAAAFLAGYSVEFIFRFIDRILTVYLPPLQTTAARAAANRTAPDRKPAAAQQGAATGSPDGTTDGTSSRS